MDWNSGRKRRKGMCEGYKESYGGKISRLGVGNVYQRSVSGTLNMNAKEAKHRIE